MPGPFPGMDPWLENPIFWSSVHQRLITYIGDELNTLLPSQYVANIGERLYVLQSNCSIYPDVAVFERQPAPVASAVRSAGAALADPPEVLTIEPQEMREVFIEIVPVGEESRVVTAIEVLSAANKMAGSEGRELYLRKQNECLESETHLIEIHLLRQGEHTTAPPYNELRTSGRWDYLVCLHRERQLGRFECWKCTVRQPLPRISVPLSGEEPDIVLDLQAIFNRCYDAGAYARRLDYRRDPPTALRPEDAEWATALLRERGLRN